VRSRCTSIGIVGDSARCDVIDHVVDVDYIRSVSVEVCDDVIASDSAGDCSNSSSSVHDVSESMTSPPTHDITETGSRIEIVLRYGLGRLGVAVGGAFPVKVRVVREGDEGHRAGLAVGDEIIDVEGRDVSRAEPEVVAAMLRSWTGDKLHLTVVRPRSDDSGHASSSSLSSPSDVTSAYNCLPTSRDANYFQQSISGKQYAGQLFIFNLN